MITPDTRVGGRCNNVGASCSFLLPVFIIIIFNYALLVSLALYLVLFFVDLLIYLL